MDFEKLRAKTLGSAQDEEAVTVNTRALIDKVLARYSGEWTTLRELLQNAADANASTVKVKFETLPSSIVPLANSTDRSEILQHVITHHTLRRLVVSNDGTPFAESDWKRLKRIAEGNPDETKIGAFGVGFYSVFADCEDPFVSSGSEAMAFYWKGNSLFTRRLHLPDGEGSSDTSFVLDYRNTTSPIPPLLSLCQFLATSLTFVALTNIELWVDDWQILTLKKGASPSTALQIPKDVETRTKDGLMKVSALERERVQMDASFMSVVGWKPSTNAPKPAGMTEAYGQNNPDVPSLRTFFSRLTGSYSQTSLKTKAIKEEKALQEIVLEDLTATADAHVFLTVTTATIRTSVTASFAAELERATKKQPPKSTTLAILTSSYDETAASRTTSKSDIVAKKVDIFSSVLPSKKPGGRIFIGFPTHQTTGAGMHLSAPSLIPTVERESADLQARWVRTWNIEMLRCAGIMSRLAFASEMASLGEKVLMAAQKAGHGKLVTIDEITKFLPEALHTIESFTFTDSTPSSQVGQIIEESFWTTYKKPSIEIYSTRGVLQTTIVRLASEDLSGFVEGIPVVPKELANGKFVQKLHDFGLITEITVSDVKKELEAKSLNKEQLIQFLDWAGLKVKTGDIDGPTIRSLFDVTIATVDFNESQGNLIAMSNIECYIDASKIPPEMPVPPNTLQFELTRSINVQKLQALGLEPLGIAPWLRYLVENTKKSEISITESPQFAAQVLAVLSKSWESQSQSSKNTITSLLTPLPCVPTKFGMKKPSESYFQSVRLFDDLPIITGTQGVKEKLLVALGVRKTVELQVIFERLLAPASVEKGTSAKKWSHVELIKYLASVKDDIPPDDLKRLKTSPICPVEAGSSGMESTAGSTRLYRIPELFEPKSGLRELHLPLLQWPGSPGNYRSASIEGRFLTSLGLRAFPSVPELVDMMASNDITIQEKATAYFIANHQLNGYYSFHLGDSEKAFLPLQGEPNRLVRPSECVTNEASSVLGFNVLKREFHLHANKFGVLADPPIAECVKRLLPKPPQSRRDAINVFKYLATRLAEINSHFVSQLSDARIVPVIAKPHLVDEKMRADYHMISPRQCFLGSSDTYGDIFDFVDFGSEANSFLLKVGAKHNPSKQEIAGLACRQPARLLSVFQSPEKYLNLLRTLADDVSILKRDKNLWTQMKTNSWLLGSKDISSVDGSSKKKEALVPYDQDDDFDDAPIKQYSLAQPTQIAIIDDYNSFRLFKNHVFSAPMEDSLESFYSALGASNLSSLIHKDMHIGTRLDNQNQADKLEKLILERTKLFLHDQPRDAVKHDSKWLERNLKVEAVNGISLRRTLRGTRYGNSESKTACVDQSRSGCLLAITVPKYDVFEVSQALCSTLLQRPRPHHQMIFETLLSSDLFKLRARGYNVDRILARQAQKARIAEEERKKRLEEEQETIRKGEALWAQMAADAQPGAVESIKNDPNDRPAMPGAFEPDSPENSAVSRQSKKTRSLFSNFTQRFSNHSTPVADNDDRSTAPPPSYNDSTQEALVPHVNNSAGSRKPGPSSSTGTEMVTSPATVHQNLVNAVKSSRPTDSSAVFSPPSASVVKEQSTYCDGAAGQNLTFLAAAANGLRIFVSADLAQPGPAFLQANVGSLNTFAALLVDVAEVFGVQRAAVHVYYDERGHTIAFNRMGGIFCNYRFFAQLHAQAIQKNEVGAKERAGVYWWTTLAHELSHNLVGDHSAEHSFYTEMFVSQYFSQMAAKTVQYTEEQKMRQAGHAGGQKQLEN